MEQISFECFINELDIRLDSYFNNQADFICCKKGCSTCCEKGDYPISELELKYLMKGYLNLDNIVKKIVQRNFSKMKKGGRCPFLINSECSIYKYRPIICRVHGLAYICNDNIAKVPFCANYNLNYSKVYRDKELLVHPIFENLDTQNLLKDFNYGEIRNLFDWVH